MTISKTLLTLLITLILNGCYTTGWLHDVGQSYPTIEQINKAYLSDENTLVLYGTKMVVYYDSSSKIDVMKLGLDLNKTKKSIHKFKISDVSYRPYLGENIDSLIKSQNLKICGISLSRHVTSSPTVHGNDILLLSDNEVQTLERPFILTGNNRGNKLIFVKNDCVNVIDITISDGIFVDPWWSPFKYPLYPITFVIDTVMFPYRILTFKAPIR